MQKVQVNPEVLSWARESAGLTLKAAAEKLGLSYARNMSPAQRLEAIEGGNPYPTRALLLKMSKHYRRPLIVFYMERPPNKGERGEDFRRLPDDYTKVDEALVDALVRDIHARQSIVRAVIEDEDSPSPVRIVNSLKMNQGVDRAVEILKKHIDFNLDTFRAQKKAGYAFAYLRNQIESVGIFAVLVGDLGSHQSVLSVDMFRGFALSDPIAPFIVINNQDAKAAWSFTILHELTHIALGQTGVSNSIPNPGLEQFCNDVAGTILLPPDDLKSLAISTTTEFARAVRMIDGFAGSRNISRSMVAYKLFREGKISSDMWNRLRIEFRRLWKISRDEQKRKAGDDKKGPDYYVVRRQRVGAALLGFASRMISSGALSITKASKVLGVKPQNVYALIQLPK